MVDTFLGQMIQQLSAQADIRLSETTIIVPTRRAVVFLREEITRYARQTVWAPQLIAIQDFVREQTGWQFPEALTLIFELYTAYLEEMRQETPQFFEPFEQFYAWGEMLLKDFDEIDKYCVDAQQLFSNVRDLKEIEARFALPEENMESLRRFWETLRTDQEDPYQYQEKFLKIWQSLYDIYHRFQRRLQPDFLAYDGMAYRYLADTLDEWAATLPQQQLIFAGFNALSLAEEKIIDRLLEEGKTRIYWDVDDSYFPREKNTRIRLGKEVGNFIRGYHKKWETKGSFLIYHQMEASPKTIHLTGVSLQVGQAHYLGQLLQQLDSEDLNPRDHAIVLANEEMLMPVVYAFPKDLAQLNITMGYPLRQTYMYHLLLAVIRLVRQARIRSEGLWLSYKEVMEVLSNPFIRQSTPELAQKIGEEIRKKNMVWISQQSLAKEALTPLLRHVFSPPQQPSRAALYIRELLEYLLVESQEKNLHLEAEYIFQFYTQVNLLQGILDRNNVSVSLTGYLRLLREVISKVKIPFEGEPLVGMQLMGFLETRVLDFSHVYILSANEGDLPDTRTANSFVPYHLRKAFRLPTHEEKDAIYAYHFYRLLQRAANVHLIYNSELTDKGRSGEMSRFIRQIQHYFKRHPFIKLVEESVSVAAPYIPASPISIEWNAQMQQQFVQKYAVEGGGRTAYLSATAFTTYLICPLKFYFRYIAGMREPEQVEESMEAGTFGTVLHETMELYYQSLGKRTIDRVEIEQTRKGLDACLQTAYVRSGLEWDHLQGKNLLMRNVIHRLCMSILDIDAESEAFEVAFLEDEETFAAVIPAGGYRFRVNGKFDRVDRIVDTGGYRIVDYKTGNTHWDKEIEIDKAFDSGDHKEVFQGYFYSWLFHQQYPEASIQMGFYLVRKLKEGMSYLPGVNQASLQVFYRRLEDLLEQILHEPFSQAEDEKVCRYCPYNSICNR